MSNDQSDGGAKGRDEVQDLLREALGGVERPGARIDYGRAVLIQSDLSPALWDLYVAPGPEEEHAAWIDTLNIYTFPSVRLILQYLDQYVDDPDTERPELGPEDGRGFQ